ncbi:hypothetical protein A6P54_02295 [Bacillus sp. MKU004]|nr:hypothetical protein A6P54_02295 [Bacillus sp. MKU004]
MSSSGDKRHVNSSKKEKNAFAAHLMPPEFEQNPSAFLSEGEADETHGSPAESEVHHENYSVIRSDIHL